MNTHRGFTLTEMLVVMGIVAVLMSILFPAYTLARKRTRKLQCQNNLDQIGKAIKRYQAQWGYRCYPLRLKDLELVPGDIYLCPLDDFYGKEGGKPPRSSTQYPETDENGVSYLYEFCGAQCSWAQGAKVGVGIAPDGRIRFASGPTDFDPLASGWGDVSWQEVKKKQLKYGDEFWHSPDNPNPEGTGYPEANFPMIRCFWHMENPDDQNEAHVVNLSVQSKPFDSGPQWEKLSRP